VGRGRVVMLTFGFELDRGNIARARVFPSLVWRLADYMTGQLRQRPPDVLKAMSPAILDVSEPAFSFVSELDLVPEKKTKEENLQQDSKVTRLTSSADKTILVPPLSAGRFMLTKASQAGASLVGYSRYVTTSIDPVESNVTKQEVSELSSLFGPEARVIEAAAVENLALPGGEFWKWIVIVMAIAYFGEALSGYFLSKRRERQRAEENTA
jgi:hypothetical protein